MCLLAVNDFLTVGASAAAAAAAADVGWTWTPQ